MSTGHRAIVFVVIKALKRWGVTTLSLHKDVGTGVDEDMTLIEFGGWLERAIETPRESV